jgi:glycosyltransferase involved in cell wall biosynthesis
VTAGSGRTLRLCFLAPGSNVHTHRWVNAMVDRGHQVLLITSEDAAGVRAEVFDPYRAIGFGRRLPGLRVRLAERATLEAIRRFRPDLVHMHWLPVHETTLRLARRLDNLLISVWGRDVIWPLETPDPPRLIRLRTRILARARHITATTHFLADETRRFVPADREITVIPFGVDCERFGPGPAPGPKIIGYLKHYLPDYGPEYFIEAVPLVRRRVPGLRFEMHGTRPPEAYRALAKRLDLDGALSIEGPVPHGGVPDMLRRFHVYVMPSSYPETFGVAAIEASACGVPVVATRVGGVPDAVADGETGLLVPPRDPSALAEAIVRLVEDPQLHARMARAGPLFVRRLYRWEDNVRQMEDLYRRLV